MHTVKQCKYAADDDGDDGSDGDDNNNNVCIGVGQHQNHIKIRMCICCFFPCI